MRDLVMWSVRVYILHSFSLTDMSIAIKPHPIRLEDDIDAGRTAQARSAAMLFHQITVWLTVDRLEAVEYYKAGRVAPYEESYPLGDVKDGRFVSLSFWPTKEGNVLQPPTYRPLQLLTIQELSSDVRLYLKRQAVHPEAHSDFTLHTSSRDYPY